MKISLYVAGAVFATAFSVPLSLAAQTRQASRATFSADADWRFNLGDVTGAEALSFDDHAWRTVSAPHDWSIEAAPAESNPTGASGGYAPAGIGWYRKSFIPPSAWKGKRVLLEFDGIASNATIFLNGKDIGEHPYAYTSFQIDLTGQLALSSRNVIAVRVDNSKQPASRWYVGSGLYRHVRVIITEPLHVVPWGVVARTVTADAKQATVRVDSTIRNDQGRASGVTLRTTMSLLGKVIAHQDSSLSLPVGQTAVVHQDLVLRNPELWEPGHPAMYTVRTEVLSSGRVADSVDTPFGIRTLSWSPERGLLLNGKSIKLLGGSVHHDNGILGAAAYDRAEERKAELLKAAGFNAVRVAHNPPSPAFLDACDRLGLLVVEDAFDVWTEPKRTYDYAADFKAWWKRDIDSMVLRDRNHPSVIFWCIGNEIPDAWTPGGAETARLLIQRVRELDPTRPTTQAFPGTTSSQNVEAVMSQVDVSGYNYNLAQNQAKDHERVPSRIMMTTESFPSAAFEEWSLTQTHTYILGDFVWTAMDYLGESGIGAWSYGTEKEAMQSAQMGSFLRNYMASFGADGKNPMAAYLNGQPASPMSPAWPWHGSDCGDIDITGFRKPISYYRDILWNGGDRVHLTVQLPESDGKRLIAPGWAVLPALDSWTWPGQQGKALTVEAYAKAEKVQLLLNGKLIGEQPSGEAEQFRAKFQVPYQPGELTARAYRNGQMVAETSLATAGVTAGLRLTLDRDQLSATGEDLAFLTIEAVDAQGRVQPTAEDLVTLAVQGAGSLLGFGNGTTKDDTSYAGNRFALFHGRAVAVIRSSRSSGDISVSATAAGISEANVHLRNAPGHPMAALR